MLYRDVIQLLNIDEAVNDNGFPQQVVLGQRDVFANKKDVRSNEFYLASQQGYALSCMFEVRSVEYNSEKYMIHENKQYEIIRTYDKGEWTELVCQAYAESP